MVFQQREFGMNGKTASLQGIYMCNMKALPVMVPILWWLLKFSDAYVKGHGQSHKFKNFGINGWLMVPTLRPAAVA